MSGALDFLYPFQLCIHLSFYCLLLLVSCFCVNLFLFFFTTVCKTDAMSTIPLQPTDLTGQNSSVDRSASANIVWVIVGGSSSSLLILLFLYHIGHSVWSKRSREKRRVVSIEAPRSTHTSSSCKRLLGRSRSDPYGNPVTSPPVAGSADLPQSPGVMYRRQLSYAGSIPSVHRSASKH